MFWKWDKGEQPIQGKDVLIKKYHDFFKDIKVINFEFSEVDHAKFKSFSTEQILCWLETTNKFIYRSIQKGKATEEILFQIKV